MTNHPALLFVHGSFGSGTDFAETLRACEVEFGPTAVHCVAVDLLGHGDLMNHTRPAVLDGTATSELTLARARQCVVDDLRDQVARLDDGCGVVVVGYSMGGRIAIEALVGARDSSDPDSSDPDSADPNTDEFEDRHRRCRASIRALVLVSTTAGLAETERAERRHIDDGRAAAVAKDPLSFLRAFLALPIFGGAYARPEHARAVQRREKHLVIHPAGTAALFRALSVARQPNHWPALRDVKIPVLVVVGANDDAYTRIADRFKNAFADVRVETVFDVSHNVPLESPHGLARIISKHWSFLSRSRSPREAAERHA